MDRLRFAPIPDGLPATVPFTGPETLERRRGAPFTARLGANEWSTIGDVSSHRRVPYAELSGRT